MVQMPIQTYTGQAHYLKENAQKTKELKMFSRPRNTTAYFLCQTRFVLCLLGLSIGCLTYVLITQLTTAQRALGEDQYGNKYVTQLTAGEPFNCQ